MTDTHRTTVHLNGRLIARHEGTLEACEDFARGFDSNWGLASSVLTPGTPAPAVVITVEATR